MHWSIQWNLTKMDTIGTITECLLRDCHTHTLVASGRLCKYKTVYSVIYRFGESTPSLRILGLFGNALAIVQVVLLLHKNVVSVQSFNLPVNYIASLFASIPLFSA